MYKADADEMTGERKIECICPTCHIKHVLKIYWTGGNITPRKRCKKCKAAVRHSPHALEAIIWETKYREEFEEEIEKELA